MGTEQLTPAVSDGKSSEQIYRLNAHECIRASLVASGRRPVLRIERCKFTPVGLTPTGVKFEIGLHRAPALAQLVIDTATLHTPSDEGVAT